MDPTKIQSVKTIKNIPSQTKCIDWKSIYKFPLQLKFGTLVLTNDQEIAFDFISEHLNDIEAMPISLSTRQKIIRILNGSQEKIKEFNRFTFQRGTISVNGLAMIYIRGRSRLVQNSEIKLREAEVIALQTDFANFIITTLYCNSKNE